MDRPPPGYDGHNRGHHNNFNNRFGFVTDINNSHTYVVGCCFYNSFCEGHKVRDGLEKTTGAVSRPTISREMQGER